jgi:Ca-activated chloride channel family protein
MVRPYIASALIALALSVSTAGSRVTAQTPVFRSAAERVTVAVVAKDKNKRPVSGLSAADFQVFDDAEPRAILDFRSDAGPVSVAFLLDTSGSMQIDPKQRLTKEVEHFILASLNEGTDEAALFTFDKNVTMVQPFTTRFDSLRTAFTAAQPFGSTSLYDAVGETAQELAKRPGRRALLVLTDGVDTSSHMTARQVSAIASTIDMPVYIIAVGGSPDLSAEPSARAEDASANLRDFARWSGGMFYHAASTVEGSAAAREIVADLRNQYLIAFEPSRAPGWHRIEVRARQRSTLQARSGYWVGPASIQPQ